MKPVTLNDSVAEYHDLIRRIARRYVGFGTAELDDLMQEGRISIWRALEQGVTPSKVIIERRMIGWVRYCRRLIHNDAIAYEKFLPWDEDYHDMEA